MHRGRDLGRGAHRLVGGILQRFIVMFGEDQRGHYRTPSAFSRSSSSLTDATFTPPPRLGGSDTFRTLRRGVISTPRSAGDFSSIGFFLAFMMLGSEA